MIHFDEEKYLAINHNTLKLKSQIEKVVKEVSQRGYKNVFLIGSGGSYAMFLPFEYYLRTRSTIPAYAVIAAELIAGGHNQLGEGSVCIFTSTSGTTEETVEAAEYCRTKGADTICISGRGDVPYARDADYAIVNEMDDFSAADGDYLLLYMLIFSLIYERGEFEAYEEFCENLKKMPEALVAVKYACESKMEAFAEKYKDVDYHLLTGAGSVWGETYSYGMCVMEEMQWIRTKTVKAAEFFHGTLEILDENVSLMVIMGEDELRSQCERVVNFAKKLGFTENLNVFDTADYELPGIDAKFRPLLSPVIITAILDRLSYQLEEKRGHSLDIRRYYRKMEY
ncbi:SIS domain-containing protein [Clostridium sp. Marseille-P3244]|uniref:SIS domain-containing protein n=1 Tax=Clostridium sp. Marseille-P3244 TaxID=1871020 RepID=UPI00093152F9|nr:SIS domain-containing protein [Clostridium sp. Marseille-P3244]